MDPLLTGLPLSSVRASLLRHGVHSTDEARSQAGRCTLATGTTGVASILPMATEVEGANFGLPWSVPCPALTMQDRTAVEVCESVLSPRSVPQEYSWLQSLGCNNACPQVVLQSRPAKLEESVCWLHQLVHEKWGIDELRMR